MNEVALDAAGPAESALDDPRLQFYLRHRDVIRTWAALDQEVRAETSLMLLGLRHDLERIAPSLGRDVVVQPEAADTQFPRLALMRSNWPLSAGHAVVAVDVEWTPRVDPAGSELPYIGVRVDMDKEAGKALDAPLRARFAEVPEFAARGFKLKGFSWWPVVRRMGRDADWWQDPRRWLATVVEAHIEAWELAAPVIDNTLGLADPATTV